MTKYETPLTTYFTALRESIEIHSVVIITDNAESSPISRRLAPSTRTIQNTSKFHKLPDLSPSIPKKSTIHCRPSRSPPLRTIPFNSLRLSWWQPWRSDSYTSRWNMIVDDQMIFQIVIVWIAKIAAGTQSSWASDACMQGEGGSLVTTTVPAQHTRSLGEAFP